MPAAVGLPFDKLRMRARTRTSRGMKGGDDERWTGKRQDGEGQNQLTHTFVLTPGVNSSYRLSSG